MNFIETLRSVVESAESSYNERDRKIDIYCESVNDQLAIDLKKAELFVMKESGTDEDLAYLEDGAIAEAGERLVEELRRDGGHQHHRLFAVFPTQSFESGQSFGTVGPYQPHHL